MTSRGQVDGATDSATDSGQPPIDGWVTAVDWNLHGQGRVGGGTVIVVRGDCDCGSTDRFRSCVEQALPPPPGVQDVDFRLVLFVDSSGVGALVAAHKLAERPGTRLVLESPSGALQRTLQTAGLLAFFGLGRRSV